TTRPAEPPARFRQHLTAPERTAIVKAVGALPDSLAIVVRDGRGRAFQRLEFLGDSVLDLVLNVHRVVEPDCVACQETGGDVGKVVTDERLGARAASLGIGKWLEWEPSAQRLADLMETCLAAAWLSGGWQQATTFVGHAIHPLSPHVASVLSGMFDGGIRATGTRAERRMGAAVLELYTARQVFDADPNADEGMLSERRAELHRVSRVAEFARQHLRSANPGNDGAVSDVVEAWLAATLLSDGADAALKVAATIFN
ncbi:MAG: ribonuclease III domain-containing protein, partial [Candidatus Nanopelagicales bacterium]